MKHCDPATNAKRTRTDGTPRKTATNWSKRWQILVLAICMLVWVSFSGSSSSSSKKKYLEAKQGVVAVKVYISDVESGERMGLRFDDGTEEGTMYYGMRGSAFFVGESGKNPEYLITNCHVVQDFFLNCGRGELIEYRGPNWQLRYARAHIDVYFNNNTVLQASVVASNSVTDIAILRLSKPTDRRAPLTLKEPTSDMVGDTVYTFGFPSLSDNFIADPVSQYSLDDMSVTSGVVGRLLTTSGTGVKTIQITSPIYGGNSGGPLTDEYGRVIGVNTYGISVQDYAINIAEAIQLLRQNGIPFTLASDTEEPATTEATEPPTTEAPTTEPPTTEAPTTEPPTTVPPTTEAPTTVPTTVPEPAPDPTNWMLYGIIALVVVAVLIVVVVVVTSKKKSSAPPPVAPAQTGPMHTPGNTGATSTGGFSQQTAPARAQPVTHNTGASDAGATTILNQGASETTILTQKVNGGTLVRKRDGSKVEINSDGFTIGRERAKVTYCISDNTSISRVHVKFSVRNGNTYIQDQKAANGTFVNGNKLTPMQELALKNGDKVTLADEEFVFQI